MHKRKREKKPFLLKRIILCILILFPILFSTRISYCEETRMKSAVKRWIDGPVRYLITYREERAFMKLETDSQRAYFIYRFWFKRDPTPGTVRNEYREIFWDRVITANSMFNESMTPGWKSDRGRIFILIGPPDIIESDTHPGVPFPPPGPPGASRRTRTSSEAAETERILEGTISSNNMNIDTGFRGLERWIYARSKSKNLPANLIIAFYMSAAGEYKLSDNPQHYSYLFPGLEASSDITARLSFIREPMAASSVKADILFSKSIDYIPPFSFEHSLAFKLDLAEAIETPTVEDLIDETVQTAHFYNKLNASFKAYYFLDSSQKTKTVLQGVIPKKSIQIERDRDPALVSVFGKLEKVGQKEVSFSFASDASLPGSILEDGENIVLLANVTIPPGEYNARIGILNLPYGEAGNAEMKIDVPDLTIEKPALSSLVLASSIEYSEGREGKFASGISITPKADPEFSKTDDFGIYYIVYNLEKHEETEQPDFDISYQFYEKGDGEYEAIGPPIIKENVRHEIQGWTFPLREWPIGNYMLEILIADNISGRTISGSVEFSIEP